jgi:hypothetical protein
MARLIIPDDFASQLTLLTNIAAQNTALGANSPITSFLTQQGIVSTADVTAGTAAQTHETNRALLSKQSENYRQLRDNNFKMPWQVLTGSIQFLKQFYKGNTKELGNWGIAITDSGKVNYPPAFIDRVAVFTAFAQKVASFTPAANPLKPYFTQQVVDMTKAATQVTQATTSNNSFNTASQQSENETELRNQFWLPVLNHIKTIGNFLMKLYANNPKALGNWGFVVDDSTRKPTLRTTKLKLGEQITNNSVVIGSTFTNIGEGDLHLYRGKTTTGTPVMIHKGEQYGIMKGYSAITVVNPSILIEGKYTVMVSSN